MIVVKAKRKRQRRANWWKRIDLALQYLFNHQFKLEGQIYSITGGWLQNPAVRQFLEQAGVTLTVGRLIKGSVTDKLLLATRLRFLTSDVRCLGNRILLKLPDNDKTDILRGWVLGRPELVSRRDVHRGIRLTLENPPPYPLPDENWLGGTTPD